MLNHPSDLKSRTPDARISPRGIFCSRVTTGRPWREEPWGEPLTECPNRSGEYEDRLSLTSMT
jgi:hypothetical protein